MLLEEDFLSSDFAELEDAITLEDDANFVLLLDPSLELRMTFCDELLDFAEPHESDRTRIVEGLLEEECGTIKILLFEFDIASKE